jgi:RNA polymerase sigma factor (sigma-70 family)
VHQIPSDRDRATEPDESVVRLVRTAALGDPEAWDALVRRYVALLWAIARRHGLNENDSGDVVQTTWLRLIEHIDDLRDPARVGAWLATTAQREALRCIAKSRRLVLSDDGARFDGPDPLLPPVDEALLSREQAEAARDALDTLPPSWRLLIELLTQDPPMTYEQIGASLGMPIGSIGPTRYRCVRRLRALVDA